jgi:hypothetical protein
MRHPIHLLAKSITRFSTTRINVSKQKLVINCSFVTSKFNHVDDTWINIYNSETYS